MPIAKQRSREAVGPRVPGEIEESAGTYLEKVVAALEVVCASEKPISLSEITARLGVPKPSVHRILAQLEQTNLIQRDLLGKRYIAGARTTRLAYSSLQSAARTSYEVVLRGLVDSIGETFNIGVLDGSDVVYVHRVECDWPLRSHFTSGSRVPAHCTSLGKAILAFSSKEVRKQFIENAALKRFTSNTIGSRTKLIPLLDRIRQDGFAQNDQEYMEGVIGLAVPILASDGRVVAALSLHAPMARLSLKQARDHLPAMRQASRKLSSLVS
ncbi:MAG: IclR family transcriptional regulator [Xanthobacteraceae bacterium]|nr:IclR family transcriptional regulator [Xanthobacteraceae bacterium]